jgi:hypothetical protein
MRLTRTITMEGHDRVPVAASVITGDDQADLPIQIKQDAPGAGRIYMDWEQWRHVCQLIDSNAPVRDAHISCGFQWQLEEGPTLECCLAEEHVGADTHRAVTGESYLEPPVF